ncbi:AAA family ATPase [Candidatus Gracilibacteria bacterium]|nr:AAA family ATPase [Candidatus Gracilibacteria bacterium]
MYEFIETTLFISEVKKVLQRYSGDDNKYVRFQKYLDSIDQAKKELVFYKIDGTRIEKTKFKLTDLVSIKTIAANKVINDTSLSKVFNKIIQYKYKTNGSESIDDNIDSINRDMTNQVSSSHTPNINGALHSIENRDKLEVRLSSNLDFDMLMKELIKYEYIEQNQCIPEGQFGLGYSNLMSIIGEIIDYIEQYPDDEHHSKLNLICIEEPEAFMHPQMQELFIKNINDAISYLLKDGEEGGETIKKINSQLIVTTHSSHILNSKIHASNSFNNINYMTILDNYSNVVNLNDNTVMNIEQYCEVEGETPDEKTLRVTRKKEALKSLKFIKKHIKHKVSELFFSDAVFFVEGITEETLLAYYIGNDDVLNKYYISIFNINGAHGLVYHDLIKLLKVPTLIITDLDIKRSKSEKKDFSQIATLNNKSTTNKTIINYNEKGKDISSISHFFEENNLYITYQSQAIEGIYATSFEEALILKNYNNEIINSVLKELKPRIYKDIIGDSEDKNKLKESSYKLQKKLSNSKSDFANELLYQMSTKAEDKTDPELPEYINNALKWLEKELIPEDSSQEVVSGAYLKFHLKHLKRKNQYGKRFFKQLMIQKVWCLMQELVRGRPMH